MTTTIKSGTFIEAVKESLAAAGRYNSGDSLPPGGHSLDGRGRRVAANRNEIARPDAGVADDGGI